MRVGVGLALMLLTCYFTQFVSSENVMDVGVESELSYLDGSGIIIAVADTGIDMDHSCFRNTTSEVGEPNVFHRKVIHLNDSIDDWDNIGHQQFRHGTHIAGILACDSLDKSDISSISNGARLVVQDIVNENGWQPPEDVTTLLAESTRFGAVINSWSWGDNTINYTERSKMIDKWTNENPWSLVFVAPGNTGNTMLEPSNAYNVVSVVASNQEENESLWQGNSHGPDVNERRGVLISAPGVQIKSAEADGQKNTLNNGSREMTGTSMAAPMAASFTALLQQLIESEYGYTPSAPLLRSMLSASAQGINGNYPNELQGYGRPSLDSFESDYYVHDSYFLDNWTSIIEERGGDMAGLLSNPWNGSGAVGPFLSQNDTWSRLFAPVKGEDFEVVMSYNARTIDYDIDDLRLIVHTPDGRFAIDDNIGNSGYSQMYYSSFADPLSYNSSNETTVMVRLPASEVENFEWLKVEVVANEIYQGERNGFLGIEGDKIGFGLVATGAKNLTMNTPPDITILEGPKNGDNYTDNFSVKVLVNDYENDSFVVVFRLINADFYVEKSSCSQLHNSTTILDCEVSIERDIVPRPTNRDDWRFEIIVADNNSSVWTSPKLSNLTTVNFSIWWNPPMLNEDNLVPIDKPDLVTKQNKALVLGIIGVVLGAVVAASIMFRGFEKRVLDDVPDPFREEE